MMELMTRRLGEHGEVYKEGEASLYANLSQATIVGGAALLFGLGGRSRPAAVAAGALLSIGAVATRWSVFKAGIGSASDPKYVVGPQRAGIERGSRKGAARRESRVSAPDPAIGSPATVR